MTAAPATAEGVAGRTITITGGTGSFGSVMARHLLDDGAARINIFSRDEAKQDLMRRAFNDERVRFFLGDVRDIDSVRTAVLDADFVFHAAALKQVPSCEFYPLEALRTNALGAENVLRASMNTGVERAIVLSTDKSVYPINAMGMSKAIMEKIMVAKARLAGTGRTILCGTRYGNVMASRGSVIPLFIQQVKAGQPLTVTDPNMTRFMMSIEDAVDLVLFAYQHGTPGDIFVQKAPAATIGTLALAVKKVFDASNPIRVIGTRHGEKLFETLLTREEKLKAQDMGSYFRVPADNRDLNYNVYFAEGQETLSHEEDYHSHNTERLDVDQMAEILLKLDYVRQELDTWRRRDRVTGAHA